MQATEALDAWSLGVLAIELLTGKPVFDKMRSKDEVYNLPSASLCSNGKTTVRHACTISSPDHLDGLWTWLPAHAFCTSHRVPFLAE